MNNEAPCVGLHKRVSQKETGRPVTKMIKPMTPPKNNRFRRNESGWKSGSGVHGVASTPPRSEMALLPRRCPRLLLIQIPTWPALGPFYVLLRSLQPVVFRSYFTRLSSLSGERAPHCLSFSPADVYRDSLSPARRFRGFPPSRSAKCLHRAEGSPRGSSSLLPRITIVPGIQWTQW